MKKLHKYITKQLVISFLLVTFSLISILWLTQSLKFVELITNKGLPVSIFVKLTSLLMPRIFAVISPIAVFVSVLFVYNKMLQDRELIVIKAAGISHLTISKAVFLFGFTTSIFSLYVNNIIIPNAEKSFSELQWQVKNDVSHLMFRAGEFNDLQNGLTIFISSHEKDGSVSGILINDERKIDTKSITSAEKGRINYTDEGPKIILINGFRQEMNKINNQFISLSFDRYSVDFGDFQSKSKKPEKAREKSLSELLNALNDKSLDKKDRNKFFVEGNKRLASPIFNLIFALIACTGIIVGNFNRRGQAKILSISISSMIVVQSLEMAFTSLATKHISLLSLYYINIFLPFFICLYLLAYYNPSSFRKKKIEEINDL